MKVLELFCGTGSWSKPFLNEGHECVGIDITDIEWSPYPSQLIIQDISTLDGYRLKDFDVIIGSPPCTEFSIMKEKAIGAHPDKCKRDVDKGLILVNEFMRIVKESGVKIWAFENVTALEKYYSVKPKLRFMVSKGGKRSLWANFEFPLIPEYRFDRRIRDIHGWDKTRWQRSIIPYPVAKLVCDIICLNCVSENNG